MIELLLLIIAVLLVAVLFQFRKASQLKGRADAERERADRARERALSIAERMSEISSLNTAEIMEAMADMQTIATVNSDKWSFEMPYGKWAVFDDGSGRPTPEIRGFWPAYPGRLIGVKMPVGSEYDLHSHPWPEILIGGSGVVWVEIEHAAGEMTRHRLGPEDVVIIPHGAPHAVAKAETAAVFICIWGMPKDEESA